MFFFNHFDLLLSLTVTQVPIISRVPNVFDASAVFVGHVVFMSIAIVVIVKFIVAYQPTISGLVLILVVKIVCL